jgi:hypothetical protein
VADPTGPIAELDIVARARGAVAVVAMVLPVQIAASVIAREIAVDSRIIAVGVSAAERRQHKRNQRRDRD